MARAAADCRVVGEERIRSVEKLLFEAHLSEVSRPSHFSAFSGDGSSAFLSQLRIQHLFVY
jgi:hypothetical protein